MLRIALADDHELLLHSLSAFLTSTDSEVEVIWSALNGEETIEKVRSAIPDVLLLDYVFKEKNMEGPEICRLLLAEFPDLPVLMLSSQHDIIYIREALTKGAKGYASKDVSKAELLRGIRALAEGEYFLDQTVLREVVRSMFVLPKQPKSVLTRRELEVACPYAKGKPVREIATALFISEDTAESHIKSIRSKTECTNRFEVGEWLKKNGLWENCLTA